MDDFDLPTSPMQRFGLYFWGGNHKTNALVPGLKRIQATGFDQCVRVYIGPHLRIPPGQHGFQEYNFDAQWQAEVPLNEPFLPNAVRSSHFRTAFALPPFKTFVLTAADSATHGNYNNGHDNRSLPALQAKADPVRAEYEQMTLALFELHQGSGKRFIICNWETDSQLLFDTDLVAIKARLAGLRYWFQLRREGILKGREIAQQRGWTGVEVNDGIEFNNFRYKQKFLHSPNLQDTLRGIILQVKPDYASYSAWESMGEGDGGEITSPGEKLFAPRFYEDLMDIKKLLKNATGGQTTLILGELGVTCRDIAAPAKCYYSNLPTESTPARKVWRMTKLAQAALRAEIPIIILWKAWDDFPQVPPKFPGRNWQGEGLIRADNDQETDALKVLRRSLANQIVIRGAADVQKYRVVNANGKRWFEVYGVFPNASQHDKADADAFFNYELIVSVEGESRTAEISGEYAGQINFGIKPDKSQTRWFTFRLRRKADGKLSDEHGPIPLQPVP